MTLSVCKFGGSSLAGAEEFQKAAALLTADGARKVTVVSAPGGRGGEKVTDLLIKACFCAKKGTDYRKTLEAVLERFLEIKRGFGLKFDVEGEIARLAENLPALPEEYAVSRGEYINARLFAEYVGRPFVDAAEGMVFSYCGRFDREATRAALTAALEKTGGFVLPGFYGGYPNGRIRLFPRGGGDITGAEAAVALSADLAENFTDVPGVLSADPTVVENPAPVEKMTYAQLGLLSYFGAKVMHECAVSPLAERGIPLAVRGTFTPECKGTLVSAEPPCKDVVGIAGMCGFCVKKAVFAPNSPVHNPFDGLGAEPLGDHGSMYLAAGECARIFRTGEGEHAVVAAVLGRNFNAAAARALSALPVVPCAVFLSPACGYAAFVLESGDYSAAVRALYSALIESENRPAG